jgi:hypothetical protein
MFSSVFMRFVHMFASVSSVYYIYLQWFFKCFSDVFTSVLDACFKCFVSFFYVATVVFGCFKNRLDVAHEMCVRSS